MLTVTVTFSISEEAIGEDENLEFITQQVRNELSRVEENSECGLIYHGHLLTDHRPTDDEVCGLYGEWCE